MTDRMDWVTVPEAARLSGRSQATIRRLVADERVRIRRPSPRKTQVMLEDVLTSKTRKLLLESLRGGLHSGADER